MPKWKVTEMQLNELVNLCKAASTCNTLHEAVELKARAKMVYDSIEDQDAVTNAAKKGFDTIYEATPRSKDAS